MMKRLAEHDQINALRGDGRVFKVAQPELKVFQAVFLRLTDAELDDPLGTVLRNFFGGTAGNFHEFAGKIVGRRVESIEGSLAVAARLNHFGILKLLEMGGDAGLTHASDLLKFVDGQFVALQQENDAQAG